jgi:hypothetical protein
MTAVRTAPAGPPRTAARRRAVLPPQARRALLVLHVLSSVAVAGNAATILVIALGSDGSRGEYRLMPLLANTVGLPLVVVALVTGVLGGLFSPWGLFRHGWVVVKLILLVVVLGCGVFVLRPALARLAIEPGAGTAWVTGVVGDCVPLALLTLSTVLSVFKPKGIFPGTR